ncbi:glycosyl hydrolase [Fulvivirgaceae bacterium BMA12]|uniref:Glycosyl hydrolase n=1 Tax=Agaribacillus aureus TaxID=3051825 RepID=A0ABT8LH25_9BACT|nr:glycosyl hydrolase [Fulvivirgaceae bacterium BMA12]
MKLRKPIAVLLMLVAACTKPGSHTSPVSYEPRAFYNALFEPETGILHGAGQDYDSYLAYAGQTGSSLFPIIYMDYIGLTRSVEKIDEWGQDLRAELENLPPDVMPQIGLNLTAGNDDGSGQDESIVQGMYDAQIDAFIAALKALDRPSFVRIGYEFEGDWNGYKPKTFVAVFKIITRRLRDRQVNAATVWCSAGGSAGFVPWEKLETYYPGDEWVDWWGVDIFSPEEITDPRLVTFLKKADQHQKPVMIGETTPRYVGVTNGEVSWNKWFRPFFQFMYQNPQVKAFCYINWDWAYWSEKLGFGWHDWKDARIERNEYVRHNYINELKSELFVHTSKK